MPLHQSPAGFFLSKAIVSEQKEDATLLLGREARETQSCHGVLPGGLLNADPDEGLCPAPLQDRRILPEKSMGITPDAILKLRVAEERTVPGKGRVASGRDERGGRRFCHHHRR
jgi:hypothetical protein